MTVTVLCADCLNEFDLDESDVAKLSPTEYLCETCTSDIEHEANVIAKFQQRYEPLDFQD